MSETTQVPGITRIPSLITEGKSLQVTDLRVLHALLAGDQTHVSRGINLYIITNGHIGDDAITISRAELVKAIWLEGVEAVEILRCRDHNSISAKKALAILEDRAMVPNDPQPDPGDRLKELETELTKYKKALKAACHAGVACPASSSWIRLHCTPGKDCASCTEQFLLWQASQEEATDSNEQYS